MVDDEGNQFVVYFLPTNDTMSKLEEGNKDEIESLEYKLAREYNWTVNKDEASKGLVIKWTIKTQDNSQEQTELFISV